MTDTIRVRPWPGLILAEVPPAGADLPSALAEEWLTNHLVIRESVKPDTSTPIAYATQRRNQKPQRRSRK